MKYRVGELVNWRGGWGRESEQSAKVIGIGSKNGRTVYDLDNGHWAYEEQLSKPDPYNFDTTFRV